MDNMNDQQVQDHWQEVKARLQERWGQLDVNELNLRGSWEGLVAAIQARTGEARAKVEDVVESIYADVSEKYGHAQQSAQAFFDQAAQVTRQQVRAAEIQVRRHPLESIAVALGIGVVIGAVIGLLLRPSPPPRRSHWWS